MNWAGRRTYTYAFLVLLLAFLPDPSAPATCPRDIFEWNTHFWAPCCCLRPFSRGVSTRRRVEEGDGGGQTPKGERASELGEREREREPLFSAVLTSPSSSLLDPSSSSGVGWFWRRRRVRKESSSSPPPLSLESASSSSSSFLRRLLPRRREAPGLNGGPPPSSF